MKRLTLMVWFTITTAALFSQVKNPADDGRKIRIPVVFHVIYAEAKENIDDQLIQNELNDLNLDFAAKNDMSMIDNDFKNLVGTGNIEFYLLDRALQPNGMKGVDRIADAKNLDVDQYIIDKGLCLNVFIADQGNASDILSDRVNLNYRDVGTHSHVLTHETGHWLGLYHIWGKIGNCAKIKLLFGSHNDDIDDTPVQWGCTCLKYTPPCPPPGKLSYKKHKILYNDFMDYNGCRCLFTVKQVIKMRNNIIEHKAALFR